MKNTVKQHKVHLSELSLRLKHATVDAVTTV